VLMYRSTGKIIVANSRSPFDTLYGVFAFSGRCSEGAGVEGRSIWSAGDAGQTCWEISHPVYQRRWGI